VRDEAQVANFAFQTIILTFYVLIDLRINSQETLTRQSDQSRVVIVAVPVIAWGTSAAYPQTFPNN